jgi:hypothetical protein
MSRRRRSISCSRYRISRAPAGSDSRNARSFFRNGSSAARSPSVSRSRLLDIRLPSTLPAPTLSFGFRYLTSPGGRGRSMCLIPPYRGAEEFINLARRVRRRTCLQVFKFLQCRRYTAAIRCGICRPHKARWGAKTPMSLNVRIALIGSISSVPVGVGTRRSRRRSALTASAACVSTQPTENDIAGGRRRSDSAAAGSNGYSCCTSEGGPACAVARKPDHDTKHRTGGHVHA